jgi:phosphoserine phosphatase RsbU/P
MIPPPACSFASLFYAEYQPATRTLKYVNAGHCPPIVLRQSEGTCEVHELHAVGPPVGMLADSQYRSTTFQLEVGDYVVAYTDGITEAQRMDDELWGQRRLETLLCSCRHQTPPQVVWRIVDQVSAFAVGGEQSDDMAYGEKNHLN